MAPGIEDLDSLFEPFYTTNTAAAMVSGWGLRFLVGYLSDLGGRLTARKGQVMAVRFLKNAALPIMDSTEKHRRQSKPMAQVMKIAKRWMMNRYVVSRSASAGASGYDTETSQRPGALNDLGADYPR